MGKYFYITCKWNDKNNEIKQELKENGVKIFDSTHFCNLSLSENTLASIDAVKNCSLFAIILDDPNYEYRGSIELLLCALTLNKPCVVLCTVEEKKERDQRNHKWGTKFDRYPLYHPKIKHFDNKDKFITYIQYFQSI